jgi:hypothetical protein
VPAPRPRLLSLLLSSPGTDYAARPPTSRRPSPPNEQHAGSRPRCVCTNHHVLFGTNHPCLVHRCRPPPAASICSAGEFVRSPALSAPAATNATARKRDKDRQTSSSGDSAGMRVSRLHSRGWWGLSQRPSTERMVKGKRLRVMIVKTSPENRTCTCTRCEGRYRRVASEIYARAEVGWFVKFARALIQLKRRADNTIDAVNKIYLAWQKALRRSDNKIRTKRNARTADLRYHTHYFEKPPAHTVRREGGPCTN